MGNQVVVLELPDGRRYELEPVAGVGKDGLPRNRLYRMIPRIKGSRVGKDAGGLMTGSYQRVTVPKTSTEWRDVAEHMQEIKRQADRKRDWRLRWAYRAGVVLAWFRTSPKRTKAWVRRLWWRVTGRFRAKKPG